MNILLIDVYILYYSNKNLSILLTEKEFDLYYCQYCTNFKRKKDAVK